MTTVRWWLVGWLWLLSTAWVGAQHPRRGPWYPNIEPRTPWERTYRWRQPGLGEDHIRKMARVHSTHYLLGESAYMLPQGERYAWGHIATLWQYQQGLRDWLTVGGGTEAISLYGMVQEGILPILTAKVKVGTGLGPRHWVAVQAQGLVVDTQLGVHIQGLYTLGSPDHHATVGLHYFYSVSDDSDIFWPSVSYAKRIGYRMYLLSENHLIGPAGGPMGLGSVGLRWITKKGNLDVALAQGPLLWEEFKFPIPFISYLIAW